MATKPFASSADLAAKEQTLEVLADGVYALTAEGDPNIGAVEGEDWYWNYPDQQMFLGPRLPDPQSHPLDQTVPGPADRVPPDWRNYIH